MCIHEAGAMDVDVRLIKDAGFVVSTEDSGDRVRDIPTESWSKVAVVTNDFIQLLKRDTASASGQDACRNDRPEGGELRVSMLRACIRVEAPEWTLPQLASAFIYVGQEHRPPLSVIGINLGHPTYRSGIYVG